jgi:hypothetical protein
MNTGAVALSGVWRPKRVPLDRVLPVAERRAAEMPIYDRSMRKGAANEVGATGEVVAMEYLLSCGVDVVDDPTINGDLWVAGQRVEVKTKERTVSPNGEHACSAPAYNHDVQVPDWWLFVSLLARPNVQGVKRFGMAWVCGVVSDAQLRAEGVLWKPGDVDTNGWTPTIPVWNIPVSMLCDPAEIWTAALR